MKRLDPTAAVKRAQARRLRDRLAEALAATRELPKLLLEYERAGDHDHGSGSIKPGAPCPGGDCLVAEARRVIAALDLPPAHCDVAVYRAQDLEDAAADLEGREPRLIHTMADVAEVQARWASVEGLPPAYDAVTRWRRS